MKVSSKKLVLYGLVLVAVLVVLSLFTATKCEAAGELVAARPAMGFAGAFSDSISLANARRANQLPSAYLYFSKSLTVFYIQNFDAAGALSGVPIPIPAGSSLILPAPPPYLDGSYWHHKIWLEGAAADSVFIIPMDR